MTRRFERLRAHLGQPVDVAWLAAFRVLFGLMMATSALRFLSNGWVERFFVEPRLHLKYWGFSWVVAGPPWAMYAVFAALAALALLVAVGLFYRAAIVLFFAVFTYVQLIDVTLYLNHYYLVSLLALLLCLVPANAAWSLDARRRPALRRDAVPRWCLYLLRLQVATVYTFAGLAKLGSDWLLHGQPLGIWLASNTDLPLLGPWLGDPGVALAASWAGFLFDTTIVIWLSWRRTRPLAYAAVLAFHLSTSALFPIGMFPAIMIVAALVFFPPSGPRRLLRRVGARAAPAVEAVAPAPPPRAALVAGLAFAGLQLLLPLRAHVYGGNVLWHEQGMRWSWRVMVREKNGSVSYTVRDKATGREWVVVPRDYLEEYQERDMSTQPDLILQLAQVIARDFRRKLGRDVEVRAEALVSLNGRPAAPLIAPHTDLARERDGLLRQPWIAPAPAGPPAHLARLTVR
jgi:hypothetical protein